VTQKDLADAETTMGNLHQDCMMKAQDHEISVKSQGEELKALADGKKIITSMTGGAEAKSYSFMQVSSITFNSQIQTRVDLANFEVVNLIKRLAREQHSTILAQLASKIAATMRFGASNGDDPFAKVKGLISEMIERLIKDGEAEASHKAYCDEEMGKTKKKRMELDHDQGTLTAKIDKAKSTSDKLKQEVADLQKMLAELASSQAESDRIYAEEGDSFKATKADLEQGLEGVRMALKVIKDYYAKEGSAALLQNKHTPSSGGASGIIGLLEVVESDFSKNLAAAISDHNTADVQYEKVSMMNRVSGAMGAQDVKYKTKESAALDKSISDNTADLDGVVSELDAIMSYTKTLRGQCEIKPESYEDRAARRKAEIDGLKEALSILEGEAVLLQRKHRSTHGSQSFRGVKSHKTF